MDYDDDGVLDMISGSYDPGDLYLFRGLGEGRYAKRVTLTDEVGLPLVHHPEQLAAYRRICDEGGDKRSQEALQVRVASFGSWPTMTDWDGDGDLDMLVGSFGGGLFRRENVGSRGEPVWAAASVPVEVGGKPLKVAGKANPVAIDWDGDGLWDLVVSAVDGSVQWYRNAGTAEAPALEAGRELVPASKTGGGPRPRLRSQLCVTDYDGDGKLDLVVGDYDSVDKNKRSYVWLFRRR